MDIVFMDSTNSEQPNWNDAAGEVLIVAAMERSATASRVSLLRDAGFPSDRVDVLVVEEVPRLEERLGGSGLHRFLVRLRLVRGDVLDVLEPARIELMNGRALVWVTTTGYRQTRLAGSILGYPDGSRITEFESVPVDWRWFDRWNDGAFPPTPCPGELAASTQPWAPKPSHSAEIAVPASRDTGLLVWRGPEIHHGADRPPALEGFAGR